MPKDKSLFRDLLPSPPQPYRVSQRRIFACGFIDGATGLLSFDVKHATDANPWLYKQISVTGNLRIKNTRPTDVGYYTSF